MQLIACLPALSVFILIRSGTRLLRLSYIRQIRHVDESRPSAGPETIALFRGYSRIVVCRYAASLKVENKAGTKALVQSWSFFFFFLAFLSETIYSWHVQSTTLVDVLAGLSGRTREEAWAFAYAILSRLVGLGFPRSRSLSTVLESQPRGHTLRFRNPFTS